VQLLELNYATNKQTLGVIRKRNLEKFYAQQSANSRLFAKEFSCANYKVEEKFRRFSRVLFHDRLGGCERNFHAI
jgi:hypothetical protein